MLSRDKLPPRPVRLFCVNSAKALKSQEFGWLNAILYMAPHTFAGVGNLCPHASPACAAACLGLHSGQANMVKRGAKWDKGGVRLSRAIKARHFMLQRAEFMGATILEIARLVKRAHKMKMGLAVRLNGSSDIAFEGVRVAVSAAQSDAIARASGGWIHVPAGEYPNIFDALPSVQFLDYTKNPNRMRRALPVNYQLTFSRSETNEADALDVLHNARGNVAVVFDKIPATWRGVNVIDGDQHDLRFLDPRGVVVGLTPKGGKARRDTTGFVVRNAA